MEENVISSYVEHVLLLGVTWSYSNVRYCSQGRKSTHTFFEQNSTDNPM